MKTRVYVEDPTMKRLLRRAPPVVVNMQFDRENVAPWVGTLQAIARKASGLTDYETRFLRDLSHMVTTELRDAGAGRLADLLERTWETDEDSPQLVALPVSEDPKQ